MTRGASRAISTVVAGVVGLLVVSGHARAQTLVAATPTVGVGLTYDTNVFSLPTAETDLVWRVTTGLRATRQGSRADWAFGYSVAADRFRQHSALSTPLARQEGDFEGSARLTPATTLTFATDYNRTRTPSEFNLLTTGLTAARLLAWRVHGGAAVASALTSRVTLTTGYDLIRTGIPSGDRVVEHAGRFQIARTLSARDEIRVKYLGEQFVFGRGTRQGVLSHTAVLGWTGKVTPALRVSVEGGTRLTGTTVHPEAAVSILRAFGASDVSIAYARTQTTTLGVMEPIALDSLLVGTTYRRPGSLEAQLQAAVYENTVRERAIRVFLLSATLTRHLAGAVSLSTAYNLDLQRGGFDAAPTPSASDGSPVQPIVGPAPIGRHLLLVQIVVSPTFGRRSAPPAARD